MHNEKVVWSAEDYNTRYIWCERELETVVVILGERRSR